MDVTTYIAATVSAETIGLVDQKTPDDAISSTFNEITENADKEMGILT